MRFKIKIQPHEITYGPKTLEYFDDVTATTFAHSLHLLGYEGVSSAYCRVARIDRNDWRDVLAQQIRTCKADFYNLDGSGISKRWISYYIQTHSEDILVINPSIYKKLKAYSY